MLHNKNKSQTISKHRLSKIVIVFLSNPSFKCINAASVSAQLSSASLIVSTDA